jgi:hypothetical protein
MRAIVTRPRIRLTEAIEPPQNLDKDAHEEVVSVSWHSGDNRFAGVPFARRNGGHGVDF